MAQDKFSISLHPEQHRALMEIAERNRMSRSATIQLAIEKLLRDPVISLPSSTTIGHSKRDRWHAKAAAR